MKPLSRRTFLRGLGGFAVSLPFLEAMLPRLATAQTMGPTRFLTSFAGTVCGPDSESSVGGYGALPTTMPRSWKGLEPVRDWVSIVSNCEIPVYNNGTTPGPAYAINQQHGTTPAPMLAGVTSHGAMPVMVNGHTADQYAADVLGIDTTYASLQMRVQTIAYSGSANERKGIMSARESNGQVNALRPRTSPVDIYEMLFADAAAPAPVTGPNPLDRRASVLDLVLEDANRLTQRVSATDRARLEQHFEEIRAVERALTAAPPQMSGAACAPTAPGADPVIGANAFGSSSGETARGEVMADLIALAFACDLTRVVSWMLTYDQVFMASADGTTDMHDDSHNIDDRREVVGDNANWHSTLFGRLVARLRDLPEGDGSVLDNTFCSLMFAEGKTAHSRRYMRHIVAGMPSKVRLGQHIDAGASHPGGIQIAGLQAVGVNVNSINQLDGAMTQILI